MSGSKGPSSGRVDLPFKGRSKRPVGGSPLSGVLWTWSPVAVPVVLVLWWAQFTAGDLAAAAVLTGVTLALGAFAWWRWRISRAGYHVPFWSAVEHAHNVWAVLRRWPVSARRAFPRDRHPRLRKVRLDRDGTVIAEVRNGWKTISTQALVERTRDLGDFIGCYEMDVTDLKGSAVAWHSRFSPRSGVTRLRFFFTDPVGRLMRLSELPVSPAGALSFGRRIDGTAAYMDAGLSMLLFGMTGAGKSTTLWSLLADAIRSRIPVELYVYNPKRTELVLLGEQLGQGTEMFKVVRYGETPSAAEDMISAFRSAMDCRARDMASRRVRSHTPTTKEPLRIFVCDEMLDLVKRINKTTAADLDIVASQGRAAGYSVWGLSQIAQKETLGQLRTLFPQRIALRLDGPESVMPALGSATPAMAPCHEITQPGVGYAALDRGRPEKFRSPMVTDPEIELIARGLLPDMVGDERQGEPRYVYRYWGVLPLADFPQFEGEEVLLYIGSTNDRERRDAEHADKPWFGYVTRYDASEEWPTKGQGLAAEKAAIERERPVFNDQHNRDNPLRVAFSRARRDGKVPV